MDFSYHVQQMGLTNSQTPDLRELAHDTAPIVRTAYCSSRVCGSVAGKLILKKNVSSSRAVCPDCGYVLYWDTRREGVKKR